LILVMLPAAKSGCKSSIVIGGKFLFYKPVITRIKSIFQAHCGINDLKDAFKQYDPNQHDVMDPTIRRDKTIENEKGETIGSVKVSRLPLPIQKKIVKTAAMFLGSPEIQSTPKGTAEENMAAGLAKIWDDNKMVYKFKEIVKKALSEKQSAMLWYTQEAYLTYWAGTNVKSKFKLRVKILSPSIGDSLYPVFDDFGDMIAFGRGYKIKNIDGKDLEYLDIYTSEKLYFYKNEGGSWISDKPAGIVNEIKKIPVIYFKQHLAWQDVEPLIKRLELIGSKFADTNDYNGMPILKATGKIVSMSGKEETGKIVELSDGATLEYLTNNAAPEAIKLEMENLKNYIFSLSHTPDISFENLKNLGYFSIAAFKAFFIDAHLNAADNEQVFGEGAQRMINLHKATLAVLDTSLKSALPMQIKPVFTYFLPENFSEELDNIKKDKDSGILSNETAIKMNPLVNDKEAEIEAIKAQVPEPVPPVV